MKSFLFVLTVLLVSSPSAISGPAPAPRLKKECEVLVPALQVKFDQDVASKKSDPKQFAADYERMRKSSEAHRVVLEKFAKLPALVSKQTDFKVGKMDAAAYGKATDALMGSLTGFESQNSVDVHNARKVQLSQTTRAPDRIVTRDGLVVSIKETSYRDTPESKAAYLACVNDAINGKGDPSLPTPALQTHACFQKLYVKDFEYTSKMNLADLSTPKALPTAAQYSATVSGSFDDYTAANLGKDCYETPAAPSVSVAPAVSTSKMEKSTPDQAPHIVVVPLDEDGGGVPIAHPAD